MNFGWRRLPRARWINRGARPSYCRERKGESSSQLPDCQRSWERGGSGNQAGGRRGELRRGGREQDRSLAVWLSPNRTGQGSAGRTRRNTEVSGRKKDAASVASRASSVSYKEFGREGEKTIKFQFEILESSQTNFFRRWLGCSDAVFDRRDDILIALGAIYRTLKRRFVWT